MSTNNPTLEDFGFDSRELIIEVQRETMGKLIATEAEVARLRAALGDHEHAIWAAYLGICALQTMCRTAGLTMAEERSKQLLLELGTAFPFIPERVGRLALRAR